MRKLLVTLLVAISGILTVGAVTIPAETLNYKVMFKWGLIHKKAGTATLTLSPKSDKLVARLTAKNESWADGIYKLRDTLTSHIDPVTITPFFYERIAHEDGRYARDLVHFKRQPGELTTATTERYRRKTTNSEMTHVNNSLSATGTAVDMVSAFYYLRNMNFSNMKEGDSRIVNIFSAKRKELLTITFHGEENVKIDRRTYHTWKITFQFTTDGSKKSSDPIETWITTEGTHVPVKLRGKLKVGSILCLLEE